MEAKISVSYKHRELCSTHLQNYYEIRDIGKNNIGEENDSK